MSASSREVRVQRPKSEEHPLGSSEGEIGEQIEVIRLLGDVTALGVERLHHRAIGAEDEERRLPGSAGREREARPDEALREKRIAELHNRLRPVRALFGLKWNRL